MDVNQNKTWNIKLFDIYVDLFSFNFFMWTFLFLVLQH